MEVVELFCKYPDLQTRSIAGSIEVDVSGILGKSRGYAATNCLHFGELTLVDSPTASEAESSPQTLPPRTTRQSRRRKQAPVDTNWPARGGFSPAPVVAPDTYQSFHRHLTGLRTNAWAL